MICPDKKTVQNNLKRFNVVPVYKEIFADFETPVSVYYKSSGKGYSFLLESVEGGEKMGRFSFIGIKPYAVLRAKGENAILERDGRRIVLDGTNPFEAIRQYIKKFKTYNEKSLPRFYAGAVGFIGYEVIRFFEPIGIKGKERFIEEDIILIVPEVVIAFDNVRHSIIIIANIIKEDKKSIEDGYERAVSMIKDTENNLFKDAHRPSFAIDLNSDAGIRFKSNFERKNFEACVKKIKEYIRAGDCIQAVLSQCLRVNEKVDPFDFYRALRIVNPSPYMYYLNFGEQKIAGASPEILVRLENRKVTIRPIAGTRRRGKTEEEDEALANELLSDEKERAEHIMLVDLARNDIGRVCKKGTVKVENLMYIEKYSHVMHIVSNVTGVLSDGKDSFDLFCACFPAGTVSGAPKIRAMQIIEELEPTMRGPYAGSICYFNFNGNLDSAITIRTAFFKDDAFQVQAGAGIVADSRPDLEYKETLNKAKALLKAFQLAKGLGK